MKYVQPVYEYRNRHKKCKYSHFQTWYLWKRDKQNIMLFLNHYKYISHHFSANFHLISWALNIENFILVLSVWCVIVIKTVEVFHLSSKVKCLRQIMNSKSSFLCIRSYFKRILISQWNENKRKSEDV